MARTIEYDINVDAGDAVRTLGQIENDLQQVNQELREVSVTGQSFTELSGRAQRLEVELAGVNAQVEGFSSPKRQQALQGTIDIFAGSLEVISGLTVAFGVQDERLERVIVRLLAVAQTANGIRTLTAGWIALRGATDATTAATTRFNAVSRRNILILVASLAAAGIAYAIFADDSDGASNSIIRGLEDQLDAFQGTRRQQIILERMLLVEQAKVAMNDTQRRDIQRQINRLVSEYNTITATNISLSRTLTAENQNNEILRQQRQQLDVNRLLGDSDAVLAAQRIFDASDNVDRLEDEITTLRNAGADKEQIAAAEARLIVAQGVLKDEEHQGNLIRIGDEIQAERDKQEAIQVITDQAIEVAAQAADFANELSSLVIARGERETEGELQAARDRGASDEELTKIQEAGAERGKQLAINALLIGQAVNVAGIIVDTLRASTAALAPPPIGLGPVAGIPLSGLVLATGGLAVATAITSTVAGIEQINNPTGGGGGAGGGALGGGGGPTIATPGGMAAMAPQTRISNGALNANAATTVIAVVAQGDIRNTGERDARTRRKARLNRRNNG